MKILLLALLSVSPDPALPITAVDTGVSAAALSGTPTTKAINMEASGVRRQLSLDLAVTPGNSTTVVVKCYESQDGTNFGLISPCDSTGSCTPDIRTYTLANYSGTVRHIPSRWVITKKYAQCSAYGAGTGTITMTGVRS